MPTNRPRPTALSAAHTKTGRLQRALIERLAVHEREGTLPIPVTDSCSTSSSSSGWCRRPATGARRTDQDLIDALTHLREAELVPWDVIEDETRTLHSFRTAASVAEYVAREVNYASLDRWADQPAPLILCESRSLAGVLYDLAGSYACPIASTNGQCRGFLINKVALRLRAGQRVLYLGDWDHCGHQIEAASRDTLVEHARAWGPRPRSRTSGSGSR